LSENKNKTELEASTNQDYDKYPIEVDDFMPKLSLIHLLVTSLFAYGGYILYSILMNKEIDSTHLVISLLIIVLPSVYFLFTRIEQKNKILLKNNTVTRVSDDEETIINLDNVSELKKTFIDYYTNKQDTYDAVKLLLPIYFPFMVINHILLVMTKFSIYQFNDTFNSFRLYDSIILITKDNTVITILMRNDEEYIKIKKYFYYQHSINIDNLHTYYNTSYIFEGINKK